MHLLAAFLAFTSKKYRVRIDALYKANLCLLRHCMNRRNAYKPKQKDPGEELTEVFLLFQNKKRKIRNVKIIALMV